MSDLLDTSPRQQAIARVASTAGKLLLCLLLALLAWPVQANVQKAYADGDSNGTSTVYYGFLYEDGTLVFQRSGTPDDSGSLAVGTNTFPVDETTVYQSTGDVPWYGVRDQVKRVVFKKPVVYEDVISPRSTAFWFSGMENCRAIDLSELHSNKIEGNSTVDPVSWTTTYTFDVSHMFEGCSSLVSLDLSNFVSSWNWQDFRSMFEGCSSLVSLDLSSMGTSHQVIDMFKGDTALSYISVADSFCWNEDETRDDPFGFGTGLDENIDLANITGKTWYNSSSQEMTTIFPDGTADVYTTNMPIDIADYVIDADKAYVFVDDVLSPHAVVCKDENAGTLTEGFDYTLAYYSDEACTEKIDGMAFPGTYYMKATGKNAYTGTTQASPVTIGKADANLKPISNFDLSTEVDSQKVGVSYDGEGDVTVVSSDPTVAEVSYDSAANQVIVTPKSAGSSTVTVSVAEDANHKASETSFDVTVIPSATSIAEYDIKASDLTYNNGKSQKPEVSVKADENSPELLEGTDYTLSYYHDEECSSPADADKLVDVGTYYVKAAGTGKYKDVTKTAKFDIVAYKDDATLRLPDDAQGKLADLKVGGGPVEVVLIYIGRVGVAPADITAVSAKGNVSAAYANGTLTVTPLAAGSDTITVTVAGDAAFKQASLDIAVVVSAGDKPVPPSLNADTEYTLTVGGTSQTISYDGELSYALDKEGIVEVVSSNGGKTLAVKPIAKGTATLTVSADETDQYKALEPIAIKFTVKEAESPEKQVVSLTPLSLTAGSTVSGGVTLKDAGGNSINGTVSVTSTKESVAQATYDSSTHKFTIKALAIGTATIKFSSDDAASDYVLEVTVTEAPQKAEVKLIDDGKTGVTIGTDKIDLPNATSDDDVKIVVEALTSGDDYDALVAKKGEGEFVGVYMIALNVNGEGIHSGFGSATLTFPVDAAYNGQQVTVWHLHEDGTVTSETATVTDGKVTITVTDLSTFAVEVAKADTTGDVGATAGDTAQTSGGSGLTQTGDAVPPAMAGAAVAAAAGLIACMVSRRRGKRVGFSAEAPHDLVS